MLHAAETTHAIRVGVNGVVHVNSASSQFAALPAAELRCKTEAAVLCVVFGGKCYTLDFFLYRASKWNKVFFVLNKLDGWFGGIWPDCLWVVVERMAGNE